MIKVHIAINRDMSPNLKKNLKKKLKKNFFNSSLFIGFWRLVATIFA